LVLRSEVRLDRTGRAFVALEVLGADGGSLEARWWRYPHPASECPEAGKVYFISGTADSFNGLRQLAVTDARLVTDADLAVFARATRRSIDDLRAELETYVSDLEPDLAALVRTLLADEIYDRLCTWPAAQFRHGAVRHGLLAHSLRVAELAQKLALAYGPLGLSYDRGLVIAACLVHDVGKVYTLPPIAGAALPLDAEQFDHVTHSVLMVRAAAERAEPRIIPIRLNALLHAILAHHGCREWGAAVEPQTAEAWLVHLADYAESRLWGWSTEEQAE
jgi:3'-5' exoribonuclease